MNGEKAVKLRHEFYSFAHGVRLAALAVGYGMARPSENIEYDVSSLKEEDVCEKEYGWPDSQSAFRKPRRSLKPCWLSWLWTCRYPSWLPHDRKTEYVEADCNGNLKNYVQTGRAIRSTGQLMARSMHIYRIEHVATMIGENLELLQEISANSDNIDYGEMVHVHDGTEDGTTGFTDRGVEFLQEILADIKTWDGGTRQFLVDEQCDPKMIERVMADEPKR